MPSASTILSPGSKREGRRVPAFLQTASGKTFYRTTGGELQYLVADGTYESLARASGITRFSEMRRTLLPQIDDAKASYYELPGELGLIEFHSKANTLDLQSMLLIEEATKEAVEYCRALIIHNDAQHFSCGVNLQGILNDIVIDNPAGIDRFSESLPANRSVVERRTDPRRSRGVRSFSGRWFRSHTPHRQDNLPRELCDGTRRVNGRRGSWRRWRQGDGLSLV